jgi:cytochrome c553
MPPESVGPGSAVHHFVLHRARDAPDVGQGSSSAGRPKASAPLAMTTASWRRVACVAVVTMLSATAALAAGDAAAGRRKAVACQTCHGLDGLSKIPDAPNLAGQPEAYLVKAIDDFRQGTRRNDMMSLVVERLQDQDVADLAAYYAAIEISVREK